MGLNFAVKVARIFIILFLVSSCGELETFFPSNGSYQVKTLVNGISIENCSIIRSGDKIRPYFVVSVADDPDLVGLLVYFQDSQGKINGEKIKYTINPDAEEVTQIETKAEEETKQDTDEAVSEEVKEFIETKIIEVEQKKENEIAVKSLAKDLPYLPLPESLELGSYTLVFEVLGIRETLSRTEIEIFYLGNAEFNLKDIAMYLPGLSDSQLISPGMTVLLETKLDFDNRLDPYVVWFNGKNIISEGKISAGAGSILWTAPEQAGFYSLRLEAHPFQVKRNLTGVYRGITLPVSPKVVDMGYFFKNDSNYTAKSPLAVGTAYPELISVNKLDNARSRVLPLPPELLQWYQFEGNLDGSISLPDDEQSLLPLNKKAPRWAGAGQSYGLKTGLDDVYQLLPVNFFMGRNQGGGIFLSRIRLPADGVILSAFFPLKSSPGEGAWVEMVCEGNIVALIINAGDTSVEIPVHLDLQEMQDFIPIVTEFYIQPNRMEAKITLGEDLKSNTGSIRLPAALSGEGKIRMGGQEKFKRQKKLEAPVSAAVKTVEDESTDILKEDDALSLWMENRGGNTIWDEFAILVSDIPFSPEAVLSPVGSVNGRGTSVSTAPLTLYTPAENVVQEANTGTGGGGNTLSPVTNIDMDGIIHEPEILSVLSEDS
jgi:hypothetical protein